MTLHWWHAVTLQPIITYIVWCVSIDISIRPWICLCDFRKCCWSMLLIYNHHFLQFKQPWMHSKCERTMAVGNKLCWEVLFSSPCWWREIKEEKKNYKGHTVKTDSQQVHEHMHMLKSCHKLTWNRICFPNLSPLLGFMGPPSVDGKIARCFTAQNGFV